MSWRNVAKTLNLPIYDSTAHSRRYRLSDYKGVWDRGWTHHHHELLTLYWQPYLDGKVTMNEARDRLVREV
jgi:hypothetical protein